MNHITDQHLPFGVQLMNLTPHHDDRGTLIEVFRQEWITDSNFLQWNLVHSNPNTLRGVHVHSKHTDYLTMVQGGMSLGLKDLREGSPTQNLAATVQLSAQNPQVVIIPPGVAHGFWFEASSIFLYSVSEYWDIKDELGCKFNDPELGFGWENLKPNLSKKDQLLPSLASLVANHSFVYAP